MNLWRWLPRLVRYYFVRRDSSRGFVAFRQDPGVTVRSRAREWLCAAINCGHEYRIARTPSRICLRCLCGHETVGWPIPKG